MTFSIGRNRRGRPAKESLFSVYRYDRETLAPVPMMYLASDPKPSAWNATVGWFFFLRHLGLPASGYLSRRMQAGAPIDAMLLANEYLADQESFGSLSDYARPFGPGATRRPASLDASTQSPEDWFTWGRIAGINPTLLRRVDTLASIAIFELDPDRKGLVPELADRTLAELVAERRLFLVDHRMLSGVTQQGMPLGNVKFAPPTAGLFFSDADGALRSLAIYLPHGQKRPIPGDRSFDVYLADGSPAWRMARTYFEVADLNLHEIATHLVHTHFCLEAVIVARGRAFSNSHPIGQLLHVHLDNVLFNNFEGRMLLINEGGFASKLLFGGVAGSKELIGRAYSGHDGEAGFSMDTWDLPRDLEARGVGDGSTIATYPYRDDGMRIWEALERFVTEFVDAWYPSPAAIDDDPQITQWLYELEHGACIPRIAELYDRCGPNLRERLIATVLRVIWASGPFHAAVNFSQFDRVAYVPAMPGCAYSPPIPGAHAATAAEIDGFLRGDLMPGPEATLLQLKTVSLLTAFQFDEFGRYPASFRKRLSPKAAIVVESFGKALDAISVAIERANDRRRFRYEYLLPRHVPNAASI